MGTLTKGVVALATTHPDLLKEWDYEKNDELGIKPTEIPKSSKKNVWWKCGNCGHNWQMNVVMRVWGSCCPACKYREIIKGVNDLATTRPELLAEWDYEKNDELGIKPTEIHKTYKEEVWWKCKNCNHSYTVSPYIKIRKGCPKCNAYFDKLNIIAGKNDLATLRPDIAKEWNYKKNKELNVKPTTVSIGSGIKVWWTCSKGHNWKAQIAHRTDPEHGTGCPYCSGHKVLTGYNDVQTTDKHIMKEWMKEKNAEFGIFPTQVSRGSTKMVWWKCHKCEYEWRATLNNRLTGLSDCPKCAILERKKSRIVTQGENDFATNYPELLAEWDYTKNDELGIKPNEITSGSGKQVWWKCKDCGNEWQDLVLRRKKGHKCPKCMKKK